MDITDTEFGEIARVAIDADFSIFPLIDNRKQPAERSWKRWQHEHADFKQMVAWSMGIGLNAPSKRNRGIVTGAVSGIVVLDLDNPDIIEIAIELGLPDTVMATTPRGLHVYFRHPGYVVTNKAELRGIEGLDVRGDGGFVVGPGSYFIPNTEEIADGKVEGSYAWVNSPADTVISPMPSWLCELLAEPPRPTPKPMARITWSTPEEADKGQLAYARKAFENAIDKLESATSGGRNNLLYVTTASLAGFVASNLLDEGATFDAIESAAIWCGLDRVETSKTMASAWNVGIRSPRTAPERPVRLSPDEIKRLTKRQGGHR